jgi:hypothetical protein
MRRNLEKRRPGWELKVMDLGLQKASDFGKRRYPSGEFDIACVSRIRMDLVRGVMAGIISQNS